MNRNVFTSRCPGTFLKNCWVGEIQGFTELKHCYFVLCFKVIILVFPVKGTRIFKWNLLPLILQVILLIAFLCVHCEGFNNSAYRYFEVVTAWFLIVFLIFFLMYLFRLQSKITCINWTLTVSQQSPHFTYTSSHRRSWH